MSKLCKYGCGKEITWDDSRKVFVNADGSKHDCRSKKIDEPTTIKSFDFETAIRAIVRDEIAKVKA